MNFDILFKSKTFYTALAGILAGIGLAATGDTHTGVQTIFIRDGIATNGGK